MNDALLAKQAWKVLQNPDSFVASFMLAKYGKWHILDVAEKANSSWTWTWKSILVGREVILKGIHMQMWSANSIHFTSTSNVNMSVDQLIAATFSWWDLEKMVDLCSDVMQKDLRERIFSIFKGRIVLCGNLTILGGYTGKSGYPFLSSRNALEVPCAIIEEPGIWKTLWKMNIPEKVALCLGFYYSFGVFGCTETMLFLRVKNRILIEFWTIIMLC